MRLAEERKMLKGGVFGFGGVGQKMTRETNRQKCFGDDVQIVAACNRGKEKRDIAERDYGIKAYEKVEDLVAHGLDFMLILSNNHAHKPAALACAKAGIPYFIEKPLALTVEEGTEMVEATEKAGLINGVNYSLRYSAPYVKMKRMADSGELGKLLTVWANNFRGHGFYVNGARHRAIVDPAESGGWIVHHMCHIVDYCIWVAGEVDEVYCAVQTTAPKELVAEEVCWATMKFKNGAIGNMGDQIGILREHPGGVIGTKGGVSMTHAAGKTVLRYSKEGDIEFAPAHIIDPGLDEDETDKRGDPGLRHFLERLRAGKPTDVPVGEALYSLKVCHAMRKSAHEGGAVKVR